MRNANVIPSLFLDFMQMQEFAKDPLIFTEGAAPASQSDGRSSIDGLSGVFVTSLGHGNRAVIDAMTEQLNTSPSPPRCTGRTPTALELTRDAAGVRAATVSARSSCSPAARRRPRRR